MANPFLDVLKQNPPVAEKVSEVLTLLDEFADAIHSFTQDRVLVKRFPGFLVSVGQEYRVMLQSASGGLAQPLFRVYIQSTGYPVSLDLHQDGLIVCQNKAELVQELQNFLKDPSIQAQIEYFKTQ